MAHRGQHHVSGQDPGLIADAVKQGARLEQGTAEAVSEIPQRMLPTVISGVDKSMDIYQTESFGPSVSLFTFKTEAEALELANDTEYGLSAAVFTENLQTGLRMSDEMACPDGCFGHPFC